MRCVASIDDDTAAIRLCHYESAVWNKAQLGSYDMASQNKLKESLINSYFVFAQKFKLEPHGFDLISVGYNENLALQLGYDSLIDLGNDLLHLGIIYFFNHNTGKNVNFRNWLKNFFNESTDDNLTEKTSMATN